MFRPLPLLLALLVIGCDDPQPWPHATAQIDLPADFRAASQVALKADRPFPERPILKQQAFEFHRSGDVSQIALTVVPGSVSPEQADSAVVAQQDRQRSWTIDPPALGTLAGRPSWAWSAMVPTQDGSVWARAHTVVVSYPDSAYVLTFWGQHLSWQDVAKMDVVFSSFSIPEPTTPLKLQPLIVLAFMGLAGVVYLIKRPKPEPARPLPASRRTVIQPTAPYRPSGKDPNTVDPSTVDPNTVDTSSLGSSQPGPNQAAHGPGGGIDPHALDPAMIGPIKMDR